MANRSDARQRSCSHWPSKSPEDCIQDVGTCSDGATNHMAISLKDQEAEMVKSPNSDLTKC